MRQRNRILISSIAGLCASYALATDSPTAAPTAAGHWEGTITVPSAEIVLAADFGGSAEAGWKGEADVPQQGIRNLAVGSLSISGADVTFSLPGIPGTPTFQGKLAQDGSSISGSMQQSGQSFPFRLERKGDAEFGVVPDDGVKLVARGTPGQGVAGEWHGLLEVGPHELRLIAKIAAVADGAYEGTLVSVDQGSAEIPLANIIYGTDRSFSFDVPPIGGVYTSQLGADGAEASGQWSQGGPAIPLIFKRAK